MPTYQYACTDQGCGNRFELVQSFTDPSASECPLCGHAVRKVYGSVGVVFKGSGFYRTDSRAASTSAAEKSRDGKGAKAESSGSNGTKASAPGSSPDSGSGGSAATKSDGAGTSSPAKAAAPA